MSVVVNCPTCGKRYELTESLAGRKARCSGCGQIFRVPGGSMGAESASDPEGPDRRGLTSARPAPGHQDTSWLEEGAEVAKSMPPPMRRSRTARASSGPSLGLLLGLGAGGAAIVGVIVGLLVLNSGSGARPEPGEAPHQAQAHDAAAPSLTERFLGAVTGHDPLTDAAGYPQLGPLLPPCLPPPPLRDLSSHERQTRLAIGFLGQMNNVLATVHNVASLKSAAEQLKSQAEQMGNAMRQNAPTFRPTAAEDAELAHRLASDIRKEMDRFRGESIRISTVPGLGLAGVQLLSLVTRLSIPLEQSLKRAEGFKPQTGAAPYAEIYVQLQNADDAVVFHQKLRSLLEGATGIQASYQSETRRASYRVWPVDDAHAFSRKIAFGKATVKERNIFVVANPVSPGDVAAAREAEKKEEDARQTAFRAASSGENPNDPKPPAGADEVTKALFGLRAASPERRKQSVQQLYDLSRKEERRAEVTKQLMPFLDDPDDFLVIDVMRSMARWRTENTVPALIKKLDHPSYGVRWKAEEILGKIGDARAAGPLADHLKEDGIAVEPALRELGPAAEPALIALLRNPDADLRRQACDILRDNGGKDSLAAMMSLPPDRDPLVQMAAGSAMQSIRKRVGPVSLPKKSSVKSRVR
jgi:HEAT repeats